MRCALRIGEGVWCAATEYLRASDAERMAYFLARAGRWSDVDGADVLDLLVVTALPVPDSALSVQSSVRVEIDPVFTREVLIACYESGMSLVDAHTHPFATERVCFSGHDVLNMRATHRDFLRSMPDVPPVGVASLVLGQSGVAGSWTDPRTGGLRALASLTVLGEHAQEVTLCD